MLFEHFFTQSPIQDCHEKDPDSKLRIIDFANLISHLKNEEVQISKKAFIVKYMLRNRQNLCDYLSESQTQDLLLYLESNSHKNVVDMAQLMKQFGLDDTRKHRKWLKLTASDLEALLVRIWRYNLDKMHTKPPVYENQKNEEENKVLQEEEKKKEDEAKIANQPEETALDG